jgi:hypothetical protein
MTILEAAENEAKLSISDYIKERIPTVFGGLDAAKNEEGQ